MSSHSKTLTSLLHLGFESIDSENGAPTLIYRFQHLDLKVFDGIDASQQPATFVNGALRTRRTLAVIDHQIPSDLEDPDLAAAWISFALQGVKRELFPLPHWFEDRIRMADLLEEGKPRKGRER